MTLYTWLFGDKNKIPLRRANNPQRVMGDSFYHLSASFSPENEIKSLRDIKRFFLWYTQIFNSKKSLLTKLAKDWKLGRMDLFINCCNTMIWIVNKELNLDRNESELIKFILSNRDIKKNPNESQIKSLLIKLRKNLKKQIPIFEYLKVHQDYNFIIQKLVPLISEEEKLLFSEYVVVLDRLLNAIQRESIANSLLRRRSTITGYDIFASTMSKIEDGLHFKFNDVIGELTQFGKPVKILDIGCDVGFA